MKIRRILRLLTAILILMSMSFNVFAIEKSEIVYSNLSNSGKVTGSYIINIFEGGDKILDYGEYSKVKNLTSEDKLKKNGNLVEVKAKNKKFVYQGNLISKEIPWDIDITYFLNGEVKEPKELLNQKGKLEIEIKVSKADINDYFFDNFMLQIMLKFDQDTMANIIAENALIANEGSKKVVTFISIPKDSQTFRISGDIHNFNMDPILFSGLNINIEGMDNLVGSLDELKDGLNSLCEGSNKLSGGLQKANNSAFALGDGLLEIQNGQRELSESIAFMRDTISKSKGSLITLKEKGLIIVDSYNQIYDALLSIETYLDGVSNDISKLNQLISASENFQQGLVSLKNSISAIEQNADFESFKAQMAGSINIDNLVADNDNIAQQLNNITSSLTPNEQNIINSAKALLNKNNGAINGFNSYLTGLNGNLNSVLDGSTNLVNKYSLIHGGLLQVRQNALSQGNSLSNLKNGIKSINTNLLSLNMALDKYVKGINKFANSQFKIIEGLDLLHSGSLELENGLRVFSIGITEFSKGIDDLNNGSKKLNNGLVDFKNAILNQIEGAGSNITGAKVKSFASEKNDELKSLQFTLKTEGIQEKVDKKIKTPPKEREKGFIDKLLDLLN